MTEENLKEFYEDSAYFEKGKDIFLDLSSSFQKYRIKKILEIYTPHKDEVVLDLGCGWGTFCFALAGHCKEITGLDFSSKAIELCRQALKNSAHKNIKFVLADAQSTGLSAQGYDVIICADLLEHLYRPACEKVLDECRRLLEKGGKLLIWTPHRGHIFEIMKNRNIILKKDPSHVDYKSMEWLLESLRKTGFGISKAYYTESHAPCFNIIERLFLWFMPLLRRRIAILAEKI